MTELQLLAAMVAGMTGAWGGENETRFNFHVGPMDEETGLKEILNGEDIQAVAQSLLNKDLIYINPGTMAIKVRDKGRLALRNMEVDATGYVYSDPDYSKEIYVGTAFICRLCGDFASTDRTEVEAHIDTDHDDHNEEDFDPDDNDQDDYRPGGIYGGPLITQTFYAPGYGPPGEPDADDLAEPQSGMDRPYNFDEPTEE
jgi:hypothetical protein